MATERSKPTRRRDVVDKVLMRRAIDESGLTHRAIAERLGVAEKTIWRYANGKSQLEAWAFPLFLGLIGLPAGWPDDVNDKSPKSS